MLRRQSKNMQLLLRQFPLLVVLLAAFVFSASNGLRPLLANQLADKAEISSQLPSESEEDNRPVSFIDCASNALVPVAQVSFLQQAFLKVPALPVMVRQEKPNVLPPIRAEEFFKILFRHIISPNAP